MDFRSSAKRGPKMRIVLPAALIMLGIIGVIKLLDVRDTRIHWARYEALPEISRLVDLDRRVEAYEMAERAEKYIPDDPNLIKLWRSISRNVAITTTPNGADVYRSEYGAKASKWTFVGRTPIKKIRVPVGLYRWKIEKAGFVQVMGSLFPSPYWSSLASVNIRLDAVGKEPAGMVRVTTDNTAQALDIPGFENVPPVALNDYWIDRYEVSNKQYKGFIDAGGYRTRSFWEEPFSTSGVSISWPDAMRLFHDSTNRPGPSNWIQGEYPAGMDAYPVSGINWFEAAAYAKFADKTLPTIWQWRHAAGTRSSPFIVPASNFGGEGPSPVGSRGGSGPWGTYDMAGNVKEWCWNQSMAGKRYILGGAWDEPHTCSRMLMHGHLMIVFLTLGFVAQSMSYRPQEKQKKTQSSVRRETIAGRSPLPTMCLKLTRACTRMIGNR